MRVIWIILRFIWIIPPLVYLAFCGIALRSIQVVWAIAIFGTPSSLIALDIVDALMRIFGHVHVGVVLVVMVLFGVIQYSLIGYALQMLIFALLKKFRPA